MDREQEFSGTRRFEVIRRLGSGGMGVVYEVLDRETGERVALKTLRQVGPDELLSFKREFRSLANVLHPGLVPLYELLTSGRQWFFTMELVRGVSLLEYVRCGDERPSDQTLSDQTLPDSTPSDEAMSEGTPSTGSVWTVPTIRDGDPPEDALPQVSQRLDLDRLRRSLRGLARAVMALHAAGKLHRDIKPSNIMVTAKGRVVMLDFGLVTDLGSGDGEDEEKVPGTFQYLAPEQVKRERATEASDWYAVGVMLYEVLTGQYPFSGTIGEVLFGKCSRPALHVDFLVSGCPRDLAELCMLLLEVEPKRRPRGEEVLRALGVERGETNETLVSTGEYAPITSLVGRARELALLRECLAEARAGKAVTVHVEGEPGMGKSALVRAFLVHARDAGSVVLSGQCFERESVPFKALDELMDSLGRHLSRLPRKGMRALVPDGSGALGRLFPVLARVAGMEQADDTGEESLEPRELRRGAFLATRELLRRLATRSTLVLHLDNAQWGDGDSGRLLVELLRPPDPPPMLLVVSGRSGQPSPLLRELARAESSSVSSFFPRARRLEVGPLAPSMRLELARICLAGCDGDPLRAESVADESGGDPFLMGELARFPGQAASNPTVESVVQARVLDLPRQARRFLELVAVAGGRSAQRLVCDVAGLGATEREVVNLLRARQMVTVSGVGEEARVEVSHNRFREVVLASIPAATLPGLHLSLARALEARGGEPQMLMVHFREAGRADEALVHGKMAAAAAEEALAFGRAAAIHRDLLALLPAGHPELASYQVRLAEALVNAGRGGEAALAFAEAARQAGGDEALDLNRRCAEQFLFSGRVDEGREALERALAAVGMRLASTPRRAMLAYLGNTLKLRMRGINFVARPEQEVPPDLLARVDTSWTAAMGLGLVDTIRGADFHKRSMLLALEAGEPERVARSLAMEVGFAAAMGQGNVEKLFGELQRMAGSVESPRIQGLMLSARGVAAFQEGSFEPCLLLAEQAEEIFRERCRGVSWELGKVHVYQIACLSWLGRVDQYSGRLPELLEDARARADLHTEVNMRLAPALSPGLVLDDLDAARQDVEDAIGMWSHGGFHLQHYYAAWKRAQIALYAGEAGVAHRQMLDVWPKLRRALFLRMPLIRVHATEVRARAALACAWGTPKGPALRDVTVHARRLEREGLPWAAALAALLRAGIAWCVERDETNPAALYDVAADACEAAGMALHAAAARYRAGSLGGDHKQAAFVEEWMRRRWIRNPEAMVGMLAPGP